MCGITGIAMAQKERSEKVLGDMAGAFEDLLVLNIKRGKFATGIALAYTDGGHFLRKRPVNAAVMLKELEVVLDEDVYAVLGHTRWPTRGKTTNPMNNQPIRRGTVIGTHNGTIANPDYLAHKFKFNRLADVDSEALVQMATMGRKKFVKSLTHAIGSMAFAYVDLEKPQEVTLMTANKPLSIGFHKEWGALFWSSERSHLEQAFPEDEIEITEMKPHSGLVIYCGKRLEVEPLTFKFVDDLSAHKPSLRRTTREKWQSWAR